MRPAVLRFCLLPVACCSLRVGASGQRRLLATAISGAATNAKPGANGVTKGGGSSGSSRLDQGAVHAKTLAWIQEHVIGLNLCPFAKRSLVGGELDVVVFPGSSADDLKSLVVGCADGLARRGKAGGRGTAVVAAPWVPAVDDFEAYLALAAAVEDDLAWAGLDGVVQLATFHPRYQFEGTEEGDVTNWTNRSPWPLFHLLREAEVARAVESFGGNTDAIWKANQASMRALGEAELARRAQLLLAPVCLPVPPPGDEGKGAAGVEPPRY